jgi:hypothetical protein
MADTLTVGDTGYSLAEAAILSQPWLSGSTLPDALARPAVATEPSEAVLRKVTIRKRGSELAVEIDASGPMPRSFLKGLGSVVDLLRLPAGWNSYSAKPIAPQTASHAIRLLAEFLKSQTPPPAVVPTVRGGIQLEWHTKGVDLEIYIDSANCVTFFAERIDSDECSEEPLAGHEHVLASWLERISGK